MTCQVKTLLILASTVAVVDAFTSPSSLAGTTLATPRKTVAASSVRMAEQNPALDTLDNMERSVAPAGGGFWFGSAGFWGEEDYRGFVDSYKPNNLINGVYPIVDRVRDTKLLTTTAESGLLSALDEAGLTLSEAEKLLPALEEAGLLSWVAENGAVLINLFGFLAVEPAKIAIPVVVGAVKALKSVGLLDLSNLGPDVAEQAQANISKAVKSAPKPKAAARVVVKAAKDATKSKEAQKIMKSAKAGAREAEAAIKKTPPPRAAKKAVVSAAKSTAKDVKAAAKSAPSPKGAQRAVAKAARSATTEVKSAAKSIPKPKEAVKAERAVRSTAKDVKSAVQNAKPKEAKQAERAVRQAASKAAPAAKRAAATASKSMGNIANIPKAL